MTNYRIVPVLLVTICLALGVFLATAQEPTKSQASQDEQTVWNLERAYWRYVQDNDLPAYTNLWHKDFLGWPSVSDTPVRKDHITDWITSQTAKGLAFKTVDFKPAAIQVSGEIAVAYYWVTYKWQDKNGKGEERTVRITHTWRNVGKDWQIVGGMSMPTVAPK